MHIAFCLDNNYVQHCAVVIASIIHNNKNEVISFHLLTDYISTDNEQKLKQWLSAEDTFFIYIHKIEKERFAKFPVKNAYINISTYFRLALPEILADIDKVIYFDCDVIVNGALHKLWNTDISTVSMAGVLDRHCGSVRLYNRLRYPMEYGYVNAGVLLINLEKWRKDNLFQSALMLACNKAPSLKNHDQDIINIVYHGQIKMLDFKYNLLEYYLYVEEWLNMDRKYYPEIIRACQEPVIIHFCMPVKPWHYECINPFKNLYYKYKAMTPWPEVRLIHRKEKLSAKMRLKRLLGKLRLYHIEVKPTLRKDINVIEEPDNVLF